MLSVVRSPDTPHHFSLLLDRDLFRRVRSYRNALFDHAVLNEEIGEDGPVVLFGQTAGVVEGHQEAEVPVEARSREESLQPVRALPHEGRRINPFPLLAVTPRTVIEVHGAADRHLGRRRTVGGGWVSGTGKRAAGPRQEADDDKQRQPSPTGRASRSLRRHASGHGAATIRLSVRAYATLTG